jgi:hypothetical protein
VLQLGAAGVLLEHFFDAKSTSVATGPLGMTASASGSSSGVTRLAAPDAASLGVNQCATGTQNTGRAGVNNGQDCIRFGGGTLTATWRFRIPTLPTVGEAFAVYIGFADTINGNQVDGAYLYLDATTANFQYYTASNSTRTNVDSGKLAVANTWYILKVVVNAAATSVNYTIDGASSQNIATNIPTGAGRETSLMANMIKSNGTTSRTLDVDYCRFEWSGVSA